MTARIISPTRLQETQSLQNQRSASRQSKTSIETRKEKQKKYRRDFSSIDKYKEESDIVDFYNQIYNEESQFDQPQVRPASRNCSVPLSNQGKAPKL